MYPDKSVHAKKVQCLKLNIFFSIKRTKCMWKKTNIFCHFPKMYPDKYIHAEKFKCLELDIFFSIKGTKRIWKKIINFCLLLKTVSRQVHQFKKSFSVWKRTQFIQSKERKVCWRNLSIFATFQKKYSDKTFCAKKIQCFKFHTLFFNQRKWMYGKTKFDYHVLSPFKKWIPTSTSMPKNSVFETEYTFFNQRNEIYMEEG